MKTTILSLAAALALATVAPTQDSRASSQPTSQPTATWVTVAVSQTECIVSGEELKPEKAKTFEAGGRTFSTCCSRCKSKVEKAPEKYVAKLDEATIAAQTANYPLTECPISGEKLGKSAKNIVVDGTMVRLCCGACKEKAHKYAGDIIPKIVAAAHAAQVADYQPAACPVSGDEVDPADATDVMYGTRLVRLCCKRCVSAFKKSPAKHLASLEPSADKGDAKGADGGGELESAGSCCGAGAGTCCAKD